MLFSWCTCFIPTKLENQCFECSPRFRKSLPIISAVWRLVSRLIHSNECKKKKMSWDKQSAIAKSFRCTLNLAAEKRGDYNLAGSISLRKASQLFLWFVLTMIHRWTSINKELLWGWILFTCEWVKVWKWIGQKQQLMSQPEFSPGEFEAEVVKIMEGLYLKFLKLFSLVLRITAIRCLGKMVCFGSRRH